MIRIVDWEMHFENNRTKELKKLAWVPFPNKHDGDGYTELLDHKDGAAHYGAWCAIVQVASKCDPRGTLSRDGARPHDTASLSRVTRIPSTILDAAIERLVHHIGWLEIIPDPVPSKELTSIPHPPATIPHLPASRVRAQEGNGREWKGMERKDSCGELAEPDSPPQVEAATLAAKCEGDEPVITFPVVGTGPTEWNLTKKKIAEYEQAFPGVNVMQECRNARQWCADNVKKRKTPTGMAAFLTRWLTKAQNSARPLGDTATTRHRFELTTDI